MATPNEQPQQFYQYDPPLPTAEDFESFSDIEPLAEPVSMPEQPAIPAKQSAGLNFDFDAFRAKAEQVGYAGLSEPERALIDALAAGVDPSPEFMAKTIIQEQTRVREQNSPAAQAAKAQAEREALGKPLTSTEINDLTALKGVSTSLDILEKKLAAVPESDRGPFAGRAAGMNPYNKEAKEIENIITSIVPGMARGVFGEVGVLTNEDVQRYTKLLPNLNSPPEIAKANLENLREKLESSKIEKIETLQKAGMNVSGFMDDYKSLVEKRALRQRGHTNPNDPFHVGKRYKDAAGNVRTYKGNGAWE
jgi:hypothetical protein